MGYGKKPFGRQYTDSEGHPIDRHGKRIEVKEHDVPMWRAYGKHKVYRLWMSKLYDIAAIFLFCLFILIPFGAVVAVILLASFKYAATYSFAMAIVLLAIAIALIFFYTVVLRVPRKRAVFYRKLKKACKKNGYRITYNRGFFRSLTWAGDDKLDLIVKAGRWTYYVKLLGSPNSKSDVTFCYDGRLIYRKLRLKNLFTAVFGLKPRIRERRISFPKYAESERTVKVIILNPVPAEVYKKKANGDTEMSGNEDNIFGYTIYSGSGFIEAIRRNAALEGLDKGERCF